MEELCPVSGNVVDLLLLPGLYDVAPCKSFLACSSLKDSLSWVMCLCGLWLVEVMESNSLERHTAGK